MQLLPIEWINNMILLCSTGNYVQYHETNHNEKNMKNVYMYNWITAVQQKLAQNCKSVLFSHLVISDSLQRHGLQHARLPCPSPTPKACSNSCPFSWWCHPTISPPVFPFSSCLQSFPASGSFPISQFFASGGQSIGASASASVFPMNIQDWFPLGLSSQFIYLP